MMLYTGIGPRNAPPKVLEVCEQIGTYMAQRSWVLRTGAGSDGVSSGCDLAFRKGAEKTFPHPTTGGIFLEVYCPGETSSASCHSKASVYTSNTLFFKGSSPLAKALIWALHPKGKRLLPDHLELHSRNVHQQMGLWCRTEDRSNLVILWTPFGWPAKGGTGMGQQIYDLLPGRCSQLNLGMFDLENPTDVEAMWASLELMVTSLELEHDAS